MQRYYWINILPFLVILNIYISSLHTYRNENDQALSYARKALKNWPDYWEALKVIRDLDLRAGNVDKARAHYERAFPTLLTEDEPILNRANFKAAIDLAYVLQLSGEQERADLLLDRSLDVIRGGMYRLGFYGYTDADHGRL